MHPALNLINKKILFFLSLTLIISFTLYFYKLGSVPNGLNQDETSIGYNAYSILKTHRDEYGYKLPLYFKSVGDYKLPVYVYLTSASIQIFGLNEFAVRFTSAAFGVIAVLLFYLFIKEISDNKTLALISSFFLATNPWHIFFSRVGFEVNVALTFALFGAWMFMLAIRKNENIAYFFLSIIGFVLSLYSYNLTRLLSPLIFVVLVILNFKTIKQISRPKLVLISIFLLILISPFILTFFSKAGAVSATSSLITGADTKAEIIQFRSYLISLPVLFTKVFFNKYILLIWQYCENVVAFLSTSFFFVTGSTHINQGIGNFGNFYFIQMPFMIYGLAISLKSRYKFSILLTAWFILSLLVASLSKDVPHATRGYFLILPLCFFSALGLYAAFLNFRRKARVILTIGFGIIFIYSFMYFLAAYFVRFPIEYAKAWRGEEKLVSLYLSSKSLSYNKIIIDPSTGISYTSLVFYSAYPPDKFQKEAKRPPVKPEELISVSSFDNYEFKKIDWNQQKEKNTLYVTSGSNLPQNERLLKTLYYPTRPVVFSVNDVISQYPVTEPAYYIYTF